ncbi:hypothetical protein R3P38DRAFT_2781406 [Favolaschia claudopus]|uniref:Uncharacterized protein n=1 Tax=Favolaschia claudopus TaxID=2862362 RepID=A0AAW0B6P4_9AGAR
MSLVHVERVEDDVISKPLEPLALYGGFSLPLILLLHGCYVDGLAEHQLGLQHRLLVSPGGGRAILVVILLDDKWEGRGIALVRFNEFYVVGGADFALDPVIANVRSRIAWVFGTLKAAVNGKMWTKVTPLQVARSQYYEEKTARVSVLPVCGEVFMESTKKRDPESLLSKCTFASPLKRRRMPLTQPIASKDGQNSLVSKLMMQIINNSTSIPEVCLEAEEGCSTHQKPKHNISQPFPTLFAQTKVALATNRLLQTSPAVVMLAREY